MEPSYYQKRQADAASCHSYLARQASLSGLEQLLLFVVIPSANSV
ncbi:hypothetical protein [Paenibacillus alvei]|nr:hypothetical protein [Paenibacillus alvei]